MAFPESMRVGLAGRECFCHLGPVQTPGPPHISVDVTQLFSWSTDTSLKKITNKKMALLVLHLLSSAG
jgi:hypothetical protein